MWICVVECICAWFISNSISKPLKKWSLIWPLKLILRHLQSSDHLNGWPHKFCQMIQAVAVLRLHLFELEKVNELCRDFCERYATCLRRNLQMDQILRSEDFGSDGDQPPPGRHLTSPAPGSHGGRSPAGSANGSTQPIHNRSLHSQHSFLMATPNYVAQSAQVFRSLLGLQQHAWLALFAAESSAQPAGLLAAPGRSKRWAEWLCVFQLVQLGPCRLQSASRRAAWYRPSAVDQCTTSRSALMMTRHRRRATATASAEFCPKTPLTSWSPGSSSILWWVHISVVI